MSALFRLRDLAIKALVRGQWRQLRATSPRLAVIPHEHVGLAVLTNGLYEREELACLRETITRRGLGAGLCLDIGANIGNHAVIWSGLFERVICFEPNPAMAAVLRANLVLNDCANAAVVEVGLGTEDGDLPFSFDEAGNDGTGTFARGSGDRTLPVRHGDQLIEELNLGDTPITFVKCDVEGFEHAVFKGLARTLAKHRPMVVFESNSAALGEQAWSVLKECGYRRLHELHHNAGTATPLRRTITRLVQGHRCSIEPLEAAPAYPANLIATAAELG